MKAEIQHELSRIFRYFLNDGIRISVDGTDLLPHDPLYLMDDNPQEHFADLRSDWGKFTDSLMGKVKDVI